MNTYKNSKIKSIWAREILDSRGIPTVETELTTKDGVFLASVPSGVSKGKYEAVELRDGEKRHQGKGVLKAVKNVNEKISLNLVGKDCTKQEKIDRLMIKLDGTENKSHLGANAILAVSIATIKAAASSENLPLWEWISKISETKPVLPTPCILLIEGGLHGKGDLDIQEFMVVPRADSFKEKFQMGKEIYEVLGNLLEEKYDKSATRALAKSKEQKLFLTPPNGVVGGEEFLNSSTTELGIEGGFIPPLETTREALDLIMTAVRKAECENRVGIVLDVAASSFYKNGKYCFEKKKLSREGLLDFYSQILEEFPISAIEDPFGQEDWEGFEKITEKFGNKITIIGDDLLVTNIGRIKQALDKKACNGLILKPNQIGTVTETIEAAKLAFSNDWKVFLKHRAGDTLDSFIADLCVGLGTGWIMTGAPSKPERIAKYNRLLEIEENLHKNN